MAKKFFYIVDHFVPFPSSEYGGIWNVIAKDSNECFDLIAKSDQEFNVKHYPQLRQNIENSRYFQLVGDDIDSHVVEEFIT